MIRKTLAAIALAALGLIATAGNASANDGDFGPPTQGVIGCHTAANPITYQINGADTDPARIMALRDAVTMVSVRTHNVYRYDGLTTVVPTVGNVATQTENLVLAVIDPTDPRLGTIDGTSGQDLFAYVNVAAQRYASAFTYRPTGGGYLTHVAIMFDAPTFNSMPSGLDFATPMSDFVVAEHELGHSVGLNHSYDRADIMSGVKQTTSIWYSAADDALLASAGCAS